MLVLPQVILLFSMLIPILIFVFLFIFRKLFRTKASISFVVLILSIFVGFRGYEVGADTENYLIMYDSIGLYGYRGYPEALFGYMNFISYHLGLPFSVFQWFVSFVTLLLISKVIIRHSSYYGYSIFVLYGCFSYSI